MGHGARENTKDPLHRDRLEIVALAQYYAPNSKFRGRDDCIYVCSDGEIIHNGCTFHNDNENEDENLKTSARTKKALC
jgi:hypothetical protein